MAQLRQFKNAFDLADAKVVLVAMATPEQTQAFKHKFELPFVMLSDPKRDLYQAFKIGFMSLASTFSPAMMVKVTATLIRGHGIGVPYGDIRQLPAGFIIETDGTIAFSHYGTDAADHPHPGKIIESITHYYNSA